MNETVEFLSTLFGDSPNYLGFIEIRAIVPKYLESTQRVYYPRFRDVSGASSYVASMKTSPFPRDFYVGALPRMTDAAGSAANDNVHKAGFLWVDIDAKDNPDSDLLHTIRRFSRRTGLLPSLLVDSGHGLHAYFRLETICYDMDKVEACNRALVKALNGDSTAAERYRILRIPGTLNRKYPEADVMCRLIYQGHHPINIDDKFFTNNVVLSSKLSSARKTVQVALVEEAFSLVDLGDYIIDLIEEGIAADVNGKFIHPHSGKPDRDRLDIYVISHLMWKGWTDGQIFALFTNPRYGISSKTLEDKRLHYITNSIRRARSRQETPIAI